MTGLCTVELGCGTGYVSAWLARRGARPVGIDNSPKQLETATRLMSTRAEAHLNLGSAYRGEKKSVKAYNSYRKALSLRATYPAAYFNLGILFLDAQTYPGMKWSCLGRHFYFTK